jgi:uncharacterized membrane-anchored protein YhcB (DUF1043 family)
METWQIILIVLLVLIIIGGFTIRFTYNFKYSCGINGCLKNDNGFFNSKEECERKCIYISK